MHGNIQTLIFRFTLSFSQDANECWTQVIRMLQQKLPGKQSDGQSASSSGSLIDQYFGMYTISSKIYVYNIYAFLTSFYSSIL